MSQNVTKRPRRHRRPAFDVGYLRRAVQAYVLQELTYQQIQERFGIKRSTMQYWVAKFSAEILQTNAIGMTIQCADASSTALAGCEAELRKALEQANMQITALEVMIQVAEEELGISIRKKSGTKQ
jgi:transposase-like protein